MNKQELIKAIAIGANVSQGTAAKMLAAFQESVGNALVHGERVSVKGFGSFSISDHSARAYYHPQSGEKRMASAFKTVRFIPSKEIKSNLN